MRAAVILKPSTLLRFHDGLKRLKYRLLYSAGRSGKPGPKGPAPELIQVICQLKQRNPRFGCPKIAQQLTQAFGLEVNKDLVRRVLAAHYHPERLASGPSWLTFLGHIKDSLWTRAHQGLGGDTPEEKAGGSAAPVASLVHFRWQSHCHGLIHLPMAA